MKNEFSNGNENTNAVSKGAAQWLGKLRFKTVVAPSRLTGAFRRFRWSLVGVDLRVLATCSKGLQSVYAALSWLMLLTATITATGVAIKAKSGFDLGYLMTGAAWVFTLIFSLALETAVLGTMKSGLNSMRSVWLRVAISGLLVTLQVAPLLTLALHARIALELQQQSLAEQISMKSARDAVADVKGLADTGKKLAESEAKATAELALPPIEAAITAAVKAVESMGVELTTARRTEKAVTTKRDALRAQLDKATDGAARERLQNAVTKAEISLAAARSKSNAVDAALQNAQTNLKVEKDAQQVRLAEAVSLAKQAVAIHTTRVGKVDEVLSKDAEDSRELSKKAFAANFITELIALMKLASKDVSVAIACLAGLFAALLVDLLPLIVKYTLRDGLYEQRVATQDAALMNQDKAARESNEMELEQTLLLKRNQVEGVRKFVAADQGQSAAEKMAIREQAEIAVAEATSLNLLFDASIDLLSNTIQKLITTSQLVSTHPEIELAYKEQLGILLRDLQARAQSIADQFNPPGLNAVGATTGAQL